LKDDNNLYLTCTKFIVYVSPLSITHGWLLANSKSDWLHRVTLSINQMMVSWYLLVKSVYKPSGSSGWSLFRFCSMKCVRVFSLHPGWDARPLLGYTHSLTLLSSVSQVTGRHVHTTCSPTYWTKILTTKVQHLVLADMIDNKHSFQNLPN